MRTQLERQHDRRVQQQLQQLVDGKHLLDLPLGRGTLTHHRLAEQRHELHVVAYLAMGMAVAAGLDEGVAPGAPCPSGVEDERGPLLVEAVDDEVLVALDRSAARAHEAAAEDARRIQLEWSSAVISAHRRSSMLNQWHSPAQDTQEARRVRLGRELDNVTNGRLVHLSTHLGEG